jgi:lipoprotein-anchoring transpeptidase ErfK/SrfK
MVYLPKYPMLSALIGSTLFGTALVMAGVVPAASESRQASASHNLSMESVNGAEWDSKGRTTPALLVKLQVLLDRAHASPGQIDAKFGENTRKAIGAFREMRHLPASERLDEQVWRALTENDREPALVSDTVTEKDVAGPFIKKVPKDFRKKARLKRLAYTSAQELLAEKFHMSERLLRLLNPRVVFDRLGTDIVAANVQRPELPSRIARVVVDASQQRVRAYDTRDRIVAVYPATVGSHERPSPAGAFKVTRVAKNPAYHYDPSLELRGVYVKNKLVLPPGPNSPVGVVWIALSAKGYGIHGTPDPEAVGKTASHGCVRLTNWDARELSRHVKKGTRVDIAGPKEGQSARRRS